VRGLNPKESKEARDARYRFEDECTKEVDTAHEAANKDQGEYDKQILTLSTTLLALLIAFIKDIVPLNQAILRGLLYASYLSFATAIVLVLFSFQFSIAGNVKAKKYWDERKNGTKSDFPYTFSKQITWLNWSCGLVFVLGVLFSGVFVAINVQRETTMVDKVRTMEMDGGQHLKAPASSGEVQKGSTMKVPPPPPLPKPSVPANNANQSGGKK
jgi:hypothetical protein